MPKKPRYPKPPVKYFQLIELGRVIFENESAAICQSYKSPNKLTRAYLKAVR